VTRFAAMVVAALIVAAPRMAAAGVTVQLSVSTPQAEVGEGIRVEVQAMSDSDAPTSPRLRVPPGFTLQGPSVGSNQQISFSNGQFQHRRGITATWILVAPKPGRWVIGPAIVQSGASSIQSQTATIEVVAQGTMPRQQQRRARPGNVPDPFDPFSMMPKIPGFPNFDDLDHDLLPQQPQIPQEYAVEHAPEEMAFLRATVTPAEAVVGQQVTLRIYAYGGRGPYDEFGSSEASHADFLSEILIDSAYRQPVYLTEIDGVRYTVVKLREIALFPLHAGDLTIGSMSMGFRGPGYPETQLMHGLVRSSRELHVTVSDPPMAGRPPGYDLGNVGKYSMSAEVEPRSVTAGDAVAVTIKLEGTGNVPHQVKVPEQSGVDWLDPTITDAITSRESVVMGSRTFRYVVRLDHAGTVDLGQVTLPYYDAAARRYDVARVALGPVEVKPGATPLPSASAAPAASSNTEGPLEELGPPRRALGAATPTPRHMTDTRGYFALLAGGPLAVIALGGLAELMGLLRKRWAVRRKSLSAAARRALADARAAAAKNDTSGVAGAVERALYTAIEDRLGLKARAVLRQGLAEKLERAGADGALAGEIVAVLDACDALRFTSGEATSSGKLVERAASAVDRLPRTARPRETEDGEQAA
jgi:hypothetical protein